MAKRDQDGAVIRPRASNARGPVGVRSRVRPVTVGLIVTLLGAGGARAEGPPRTIDQLAPVSSRGPLLLDAGLSLALPATWQTGLSTGVEVGAAYAWGRALVVGARLSWATASESSLAWMVTHQDLRPRLTAALQRSAGRGVFALRLGLGPTVVYERRVRNQGERAGLTGSDLATSTWTTLPAGELEGVVGVHVGGPWLLVLAGGPSLLLADGAFHGGWATQLAVGWQP